jgi:hypothetical protein
MNMINYWLIAAFVICMLAIYIERRLNYPLGLYDGIVLCLIPPFIKRVRLWNSKWIGFDNNWKFVFFKKLDD